MTDFSIPEGKNTPSIQFLSRQDKLIFKGKSFPENARKFFEDVNNNLYSQHYPKKLMVEIDLDYMSSSSVICILDLLKRMKNQAPETSLSVNFLYDAGDDDMMGIGENYQKILGNMVTLCQR